MKQNFILLFIFIVLHSQAQEEKKSFQFTLEQAIDFALKNNYKTINAQRDIESAKQKKWETTAAGLPQISSNVQYLNNLDFQVQGVSGNAFNPGGNPNEVTTIAFGTRHSMNASATLSQLIFDGSYIVALQASKTYLQFFENSKNKTELEIKQLVTSNYGNVLLAQENVTILQKNKKTLEQNLFETKEFLKNGLIEEENVEQIQITLNTINSSLNNVTRLIDISTKMLKITLGMSIDDNLVLTDKLNDLTLQKIDLNFEQTAFEVTDNIDFKIAQNFTEQRRLEFKREKAAYLPSLSASFNYGYNSFANNFTLFNQSQPWNNYSNFAVNLKIPIFSSFGRRAKNQQAKIAFEQSKTQLTETEQMLQLQFNSAKSDYAYSIEQLESSKQNLRLSERIENKQQIKFKEGLSTSFEFTEAQRQLYTAQQNYLQAMIDVLNKKTTLDKLTNKN